MKKIILFILSSIICFSAVAKHHKKKLKATNDIISVAVRHTACYGRCPNYTVEINKSGLVIFTGKQFIADTGIFEKNIDPAKAMEVISQFNTYRVDTCKDSYINRATDLPGIILTIKYNNSTKVISNANAGPYFLTTLGGLIDKAGKKTDNDGWQKVVKP